MDQPKTERHIAIGGQLSIQTNKIIVGREQGDSPDLGPLFVNNAEFLVIGSDFYLDLGILRPDEVAEIGASRSADESATSNGPIKIDFFVLQRVAMSEFTFRTLVGKAQTLIDRMDSDRKEKESKAKP